MNDRDNSTESFDVHKESGGSGHYRRRIYEVLLVAGRPLSDRELMEVLGVTDPNYIRPEVTRLRDDGIIAGKGNKTCQFTNRKVRLSVLTGAPYAERKKRTVENDPDETSRILVVYDSGDGDFVPEVYVHRSLRHLDVIPLDKSQQDGRCEDTDPHDIALLEMNAHRGYPDHIKLS